VLGTKGEMKNFLNSFPIDEAFRKVEGLEIRQNPAAMEVFCQVVIDYCRQELRAKGIDLLTLATYEEVRSFCRLWLSTHSEVNPENAFIGLACAIEANAYEGVRVKRARGANE
jgi:hypothetical protein